MYDNSSAGMTF